MFSNLWNRMTSCFRRSEPREPEPHEINLLQQKRIGELPLFLAAKKNKVRAISVFLNSKSCDPFQKGALGETALHVAVQYNNLEAVMTLLDTAPALLNMPMTSTSHDGLTALHIAVVNQNVNMVKELVRRGADVSAPRATGTFFKHGRQKHFYFGNTVLHILTLQPYKIFACQIYDIIQSYDKGCLDQTVNHKGLTPFKMAAYEGNTVMFQHLMQKRKQVQWALGPITCTLYDLTEIDLWGEHQSVLELVTSSKKKEASQILHLTPVKELVNLKWQHYGRPYFCILAAIYVAYMVCVSLCCVNRPLKHKALNPNNSKDITIFAQETLEKSYVSSSDHLRLAGEIISVTGAIIILLLKIPDLFQISDLRYFVQAVQGGPFSITSVSFACLVLAILIMRLTGCDGEVIPMSGALVLGWCYVMYFARGFQMLGPFTIMLHKMIFGDLLRFCWLMAVVILGFATAFYIIFQTEDSSMLGEFQSYPMALFSTFELFLNVINSPTNYDVDIPNIFYVIYFAFTIIANLLMLNLIIAMMGDTHWRVAQEMDELWRTQVVAASVMLERKIPHCLWTRSGICGKAYGLGDRWYLRIIDRKDHTKQKMQRYVDAFQMQEGENSEKTTEKSEKHREKDSPTQQRPTDPRPSSTLHVPENITQRKQSKGWERLKSATLEELQGKANKAVGLDEHEIHHV
ncbi:transient receptor potential cation channel subfamily V member 6-like isoform X2 [Pleurodeles waltl]|uniref:transient receptor potential cation channel subfamily V member 6-like isoform X2 n=1 Tax=Pleurodeles waltl TaxID=8319 RepID=UPI003709AA8A